MHQYSAQRRCVCVRLSIKHGIASLISERLSYAALGASAAFINNSKQLYRVCHRCMGTWQITPPLAYPMHSAHAYSIALYLLLVLYCLMQPGAAADMYIRLFWRSNRVVEFRSRVRSCSAAAALLQFLLRERSLSVYKRVCTSWMP
jgi:hypothetical protein